MNTIGTALDLLRVLGIYYRDLEIFDTLKNYVGQEEFRRFLDFLLEEAKNNKIFIANLREGREIAEGLSYLALDLITGVEAAWAVEYVDEPYNIYLDSDKLYVFDKRNNYQRFLVDEGFISTEYLVIERIDKKEIEGVTVPIFVAIDGTEYPAIMDLLYEPEEWGKLENPHFLHPLELKIDITPEEAEELLERPAELKKLLAQAL
jgi:hypothetical protein